MKVKVNNIEVELRYSLRIYMVFESMVNRAFNPNLVSDSIMLFLSAIISSNQDCDITLDSLVDMIDADPKLLDDFVRWYSDKAISNSSKKKMKQKETP